MDIVLGAHQPGTVLVLWSGVKLQLLTSARDLERAEEVLFWCRGGHCSFASWVSELGGIPEQEQM